MIKYLLRKLLRALPAEVTYFFRTSSSYEPAAYATDQINETLNNLILNHITYDNMFDRLTFECVRPDGVSHQVVLNHCPKFAGPAQARIFLEAFPKANGAPVFSHWFTHKTSEELQRSRAQMQNALLQGWGADGSHGKYPTLKSRDFTQSAGDPGEADGLIAETEAAVDRGEGFVVIDSERALPPGLRKDPRLPAESKIVRLMNACENADGGRWFYGTDKNGDYIHENYEAEAAEPPQPAPQENEVTEPAKTAPTKLRIWKLGSLEHRIVPSDKAVRRLQRILNKWDHKSDLDVIWGPDPIELVEFDVAHGDRDLVSPTVNIVRED